MPKVRWSEDYGQYKKGDEFVVDNLETLEYFISTGKVEMVKQKAETATPAKAETAVAKEETTNDRNKHHQKPGKK